MERKMKSLLFLLFFLSFCFFSSVFLMIFSLFSFYLLFWEWEKENEISVISSLFSSFLGRSNWKKWRKFFLFFVPFFLIFSFWKPFSFSVFPSFSGGGMEREKDKGDCLLEDNPFLQEHSTFLKFIFGKKNTPKNSYFMPKIRLKMPKIITTRPTGGLH